MIKKIFAEIKLIQGENGKEKSKYNRKILQYKCSAIKFFADFNLQKIVFCWIN